VRALVCGEVCEQPLWRKQREENTIRSYFLQQPVLIVLKIQQWNLVWSSYNFY